jgi:aminomethyltransferase
MGDKTTSQKDRQLKRTPLYDRHLALSARMVDFGGWHMPVQYTSILEEHRTVRSAVGLFDVSHMGEAEFEGPGAMRAVERLVTNDIAHLEDGQARYTAICYPDGGIVDDCIVYRHGPERFLIVINASNIDKDLAWFRDHLDPAAGVTLTDLSDETALIAVQGPRAAELVAGLAAADGPRLLALRPFTFAPATLHGTIAVVAARTGYTGEDGYELFCRPEDAGALWDALLQAGQPLGVRPCGLGARDTLRLEACLCLYGNDIDATTTPYEAGLGWLVKLDHDFIGREALLRQKAEGIRRRLCGFVMEGRGTARHGYPIYAAEAGGEPVGTVTSGSIGPTVGRDIGLGYVPVALCAPGTRLFIDCRGKRVPAQVVKTPFYRRPSQRS